ncbi:MAG: glpgli family protein [Bacteroidia bacterium]|nr:glpgli family protein [Bacteroidia bacterium]
MKKLILLSAVLLGLSAGLTSVWGASSSKLLSKLKKAKGVVVTYQSSSDGTVYPGKLVMTVSGNAVAIVSVKGDDAEEGALKEENFIDYSGKKSFSRTQLPDSRFISTATPFEFNKGLTVVGEESVLGLTCTVAQTVIRSNTIKIWYTKQVPFLGTPSAGVGVPDGLVLKITYNGNRALTASTIEPMKKELTLLPTTFGKVMDSATYRFTINNSGVKTIPVFTQGRIHFDGAKMPDTLEADRTYNVGGGTIILKKVKLPAKVDGQSIFVELTQYSDGDAYDRTGSVFVIPTDKPLSYLDAIRSLKSVPAFVSGGESYPGLISTPDYAVPVELMRFFTSFGVGKFNDVKVPGQVWADSILYKTDVTALASVLKDEVWIGAYIGNWDKNGHQVNLRLKYYPDGRSDSKLKVMPLFNTVNYLEQAGQPYPTFMQNDSLRVTFTLQEEAKDAKLFYFTTGHGGWGNGDEFNPKLNTLSLDGQKVISFIPWRDDCGTYRSSNPASGNFSNGLSSSDLSRSNWCPGTVTNPDYISLGHLKAGEHTLTVKIPVGPREGGSFSYWCISGALLY